jgi:tetratricopeptide (TPR) repeat protein
MPDRAAAQCEYDQAVLAHAGHFIALLERESPRLSGAGRRDGGRGQLLALRRLKQDLSNIVQAVDTAVACSSLNWLLAAADHLRNFLDRGSEFRQQHASYSLLAGAAERLTHARLAMLAGLGLSAAYLRLGDVANCFTTATRAQDLARQVGDEAGQALALRRLATVEYFRRNLAGALALHAEALACCERLGDLAGQVAALLSIGALHLEARASGEARTCLRRVLQLARAIGDRFGAAAALNNLGLVEYIEDNLGEAESLYTRALAIERDAGGSQRGAADALGNLGLLANLRGDHARAMEFFGQALELQQQISDPFGEGASCHNLAYSQCRLGDYAAARANLQHSLVLKQRTLGTPPILINGCLVAASVLLGLKRYAAAAAALEGTLVWAAKTRFELDPTEQAELADVRAALLAAAAREEFPLADLETARAAGAELDLSGLVAFVTAQLSATAPSPAGSGSGSARSRRTRAF